MVMVIERNIGRKGMENIKDKMNIKRYHIGKIAISKTNFKKTLEAINEAIIKNNLGYICVTNTRTTYLANQNPSYCKIQNNSLLTVPDGTPLVWLAHNMGFKEVNRVPGPKLMIEILSISEKNKYSHFFYGSTPMVIKRMNERLKSEVPKVEVKGIISPPFQLIENFDIDTLASELNKLKPTFFWCGLGAPKQEKLISLLQPKLKSTICIGVGLAFEHYAGTVFPPPPLISKLKLEWLFRCYQQPLKARRFIIPFFWMVKRLFYNFIFIKIFNKS